MAFGFLKKIAAAITGGGKGKPPAKGGFSYVLQEEELTNDTLLRAIRHVTEHRQEYVDAMEQSKLNEAITTVMDILESVAKK